MSEEGTTHNLESFITVLQTVEEKVRNTNKAELRTFRMMYGWSNPPLTQIDLANKIKKLRRYIERHSFVVTENDQERLRRLEDDFTNWTKEPLSNLYNSSYATRVCYLLDCLLDASYAFLNEVQDDLTVSDLQADYKIESRRIRALRQRLDSAESETGDVERVIERIQEADRTAQSLPETLSSLRMARAEAEDCSRSAEKHLETIQTYHVNIEAFHNQIKQLNERASETLEASKHVLASSTSAGLAHAFDERKKELQKLGWYWTGGLVASLCGALWAICSRADAVFALLEKSNQVGTLVLVANFLISIAFIGAPIWAAWIATKQVGYYFRLSEDYAFKAAVSTSYEGFRSQAARFDDELERKVLSSTLDRYDEPPLRFVDERVVGSPYHEILTSPDFKEAAKVLPDFARDVLNFSKEKLKSAGLAEKVAEKVVDKVESAVKSTDTKQ